MRPVERGADPGGYVKYSAARRPLKGRIGYYCSYCEAPLKNGEVEHILPQKAYPDHKMDWDNFIFACGNCNPSKGNWPRPCDGGRDAAYWPDTDNTACAYEYRRHLPPRVAGNLTAGEQKKAEALLQKTGVDKHPGHSSWSTRDDRWELRMEAWGKAEDARLNLEAQDTLIVRKCIASDAAGTGFWSVWRAVFVSDPDMLRRLNNAFVGTAIDCFDSSTLAPIRGGRGRL